MSPTRPSTGTRPTTRRPRSGTTRRVVTLVVTATLLLTACGDTPSEPDTDDGGDAADAATDDGEQRFPDVIEAELEPSGDAWRLDATVSSPYDTPERYADAFRALDGNGVVLGVRELAHDHANEQPFTRSLTGLEIPDDVERITVEGRDQRHGWGGATVEVQVPPADG